MQTSSEFVDFETENQVNNNLFCSFFLWFKDDEQKSIDALNDEVDFSPLAQKLHTFNHAIYNLPCNLHEHFLADCRDN